MGFIKYIDVEDYAWDGDVWDNIKWYQAKAGYKRCDSRVEEYAGRFEIQFWNVICNTVIEKKPEIEKETVEAVLGTFGNLYTYYLNVGGSSVVVLGSGVSG